MEAVRLQQFVENDGEVIVKGLPYKKGQAVEVILFPQSIEAGKEAHFTVGDLKKSGILGLWRDRVDIVNSSEYARHLREHAQKRRDIEYDFA